MKPLTLWIIRVGQAAGVLKIRDGKLSIVEQVGQLDGVTIIERARESGDAAGR